MADLHEYTTKEVLNKVLLDSSGNAVAAYSHTSQEALNAVLDSTNSRLNVSLVGGTISGDVTISGDLTVTGDSAIATNEVIQGTSIIDVTSTEAFLVRKDSDGGDVFVVDTTNNKAIVGVVLGSATHPSLAFGDGNTGLYEVADNTLAITTLGSERMRINNVGDVGIGGGTNSNIKVYIQDSTDSASAWATSIYQGGAGGNGLRVDVASTDASDFIFQAGANNGGTQVLNVMADGKVGIGTNSISSPLHLKVNNNNSDPHFFIENANNGGRSHARFYNSSRSTYWSFGQQNDDSFVFSNHLNINSSQKFILDANSRISLSNNDNNTGNTVFGKNAFNASSDNVSDYNVAVGESAMGTGAVSGAVYNTAVGYKALDDLTGGDANVAVGSFAGTNITTGVSNVAIGAYDGTNFGALHVNTVGSYNIAIGTKALGIANENDNDGTVAIGHFACAVQAGTGGAQFDNATVGIGYKALTALTTGVGNTSIGYEAGKEIDDGNGNTILGYQAALTHAGGQYNVVIGWKAMDDTDAGGSSENSNNNVAIGASAMGGTWANATTEFNVAIGTSSMAGALNNSVGTVAIGYQSLFGLTSGAKNTAIGYESSKNTIAGQSNTSIGYQSLTKFGSSSGGDNSSYNTAVGDRAMGGGHNTTTSNTGFKNVAIGQLALGGSTGTTTAITAHSNVAIGFEAGKVISSANNNVFIGRGAGDAVTTGSSNTAVGSGAGGAIIGGSNNTALGVGAGSSITTGANNTYIGYVANASANDVNDEIVLSAGSDAVTGGGTETIRIGVDSDFITNDFGENATWTHSSDKRIKKDIEDSELGLDFINDLRPVTFKKKAPSEYPQEFEQYDASTTERKNPNRKHYGFIAQEVKEAMDNAGHSEFPVWKENRDGMQELGETELITPLIKAVQELSAKVKELEAKLSK
jgi:trimeric autotransporter adhesin